MAIFRRFNLEDPLLLGGMPPGPAAAAEAREVLTGWDITDEASARTEIAHVLAHGHRADYDAVRTTGHGDRRELRFVNQHAAELGDRSLIAWDMANVTYLAGAAFLAGFLDEASAWELCMTAARTLQPKFTSWEAFGKDYLLGYAFHEADDDRGMHHVFRALVLEHEGPWKLAWNTPLT